MKLNVGCGGKTFAFHDLGCDVNCDIQKPRVKISNFILSDIRYLPFIDKAFEKVYAFNVLEHVSDYTEAVRELNRTGKQVVVRSDKIYNLANWFTADHQRIAFESTLIPFPPLVSGVVRLVRFPIEHSRFVQNAVHKTFPALRKIGVLDSWNYHESN